MAKRYIVQDYILKLPENNNKALALLNYLRTFDFIEISKASDWYDELNSKHKDAINRGIEDLENGNIHADEDVRKEIHQRILKAHTK